jgi:hypothetical protein
VTLQGYFNRSSGDYEEATEVGFYLNPTSSIPLSDGLLDKYTGTPGTMENGYVGILATIPDLNPDETYFYQAYISRPFGGYSYGPWQSFTTASAAIGVVITPGGGTQATSVPEVQTGSTLSITGLTSSGVTLSGGLTNTGGTTVANVGFYLNTSANQPNGSGEIYSSPGTSFSTGPFTKTIIGLTAGTTYYYRAFAENSVGIGYGTEEYSFTTISDFTSTINNGSVTITEYTGTGGPVMIPSTIGGLPVTQIGNEAFKDKTTITSITLPDSVLSIGYGAFYRCEYLATVSLGSGVTTIGAWAVGHCYRL